MHAEVCGVLVGSLCWDDGPYLLIDGRIEGKNASHQSGSVTFTSETWDYIHEELPAKHPDRIIVGWYHTHPGFGIFLSNMDAFIHENFFSFPWQPAYVFDPQAETDGFFFRIGTELAQENVSVAPDVAPSVKGPEPGFAAADRVVISEDEDAGWNRYLLPGIVAVVSLGGLAMIAAIATHKVRDAEQAAKVSETKAEEFRCALTDKDSEIRRHKKNEDDWHIRKETYEKEIAGLKITVTTITTEKNNLETSNKEKQTTVERLKSERAKLEKEVQEREAQISSRNSEVEQVKKELAAAREQIQKLEQRIKDLETDAPAVKAPDELPQTPQDAEPVTPPAQGEQTTVEGKPWYFRLLFWK